MRRLLSKVQQMAVPKRKTSRMKRGHRNSNRNTGSVHSTHESTVGDITLSHRLSVLGYYKGKKHFKEKEKENSV